MAIVIMPQIMIRAAACQRAFVDEKAETGNRRNHLRATMTRQPTP